MSSCKQSGLCPPLVIYIALSSIGILSMMSPKNSVKDSPDRIWQAIAYTVIMSLLLYYLCSQCHNTIAWGLLLLPFILLAVMFILFKGDFDRILKDIGKKCNCN